LFSNRGTCSKFLGRARTTDANAVYTSRATAILPSQAGVVKQNENEVLFQSSVDGIVAHAGGGQGSAVVLTANVNNVTTVGTGGDSVKLPPSVSGIDIIVHNSGALSLNVFPATGDKINALAINTALALPAGTSTTFTCLTAGTWITIPRVPS